MTQLDDLIEFLAASPSPWHVVSTAADRLVTAGFAATDLGNAWSDLPSRGFAIHGAALVAWSRGDSAAVHSPLRLVGAHTDSPCLRVKPRPDTGGVGWKQLGVEVYGGALINSWLDRDLGVAGRVELADGSSVDVLVDEAVCRVPQLAIHLDRDVNERGLVLDKQQHLAPVWGRVRPGRASSPAGSPAGSASVVRTLPAGICACSIARHLQFWAAIGRCWPPADSTTRCRAGRPFVPSAPPTTLVTPPRSSRCSTTRRSGRRARRAPPGPLLEHVLERLALASGASRRFLTQSAT